jgi:hypothetical protein
MGNVRLRSTLFLLVYIWSFPLKLTAVVSKQSRFPFPLEALPYCRNIVMKHLPVPFDDVFKVCWKEIQVGIKEVYIVHHNFVSFKNFFNQICANRCFVSAEKVVRNQFECPHVVFLGPSKA